MEVTSLIDISQEDLSVKIESNCWKFICCSVKLI